MSRESVRGRFVWHELMTTDTRAALAYYPRVVGWTTEAWPKDPSYLMFAAPSGPVAGCMILPDEAKAMGAPPCWLGYIGTPDADATARHAVELGGRVLRAPADIPSVGRFAVLQDPQGAVFNAFTPTGEGMGGGAPKLGEFSWHELATTDWPAAFSFYARLFGWEKTGTYDMGPEMGVYQMFGLAGTTMGGMFNKPANMPAPPNWLPYALVPDAKKAAAAAAKAGGKVINGPMEVPGGDWIAVGMDPQGAVFAVHSKTPAAKAAAPAKPKPAAKKAAPKKAATKKAASKKAAPRKRVAKRAPAKRKVAKKKAARKPARRVAAKPARRKRSAAKQRPARRAARRPARKAKPAKRKSARRAPARRRRR